MLPAEAFPNALLKQWETEIFVLHFFIFAFFSKTVENENLHYLILLQNCGKQKFSLW